MSPTEIESYLKKHLTSYLKDKSFVVPDVTLPYGTNEYSAMEKICRDLGFSIMIVDCGRNYSEQDIKRIKKDMLYDKNQTAIVFTKFSEGSATVKQLINEYGKNLPSHVKIIKCSSGIVLVEPSFPKETRPCVCDIKAMSAHGCKCGHWLK